MAIKQVKINVNEVTIGMFISGLDRPWAQTPFPIQGFYIRDIGEIKELRGHCNHVYIDVVKGAQPKGKAYLKTLEPQKNNNRYKSSLAIEKLTSVKPITIKYNTYDHYEPLKKEAKKARQLYTKVFASVSDVLEQLENDVMAPVHDTKRAAGEMVDSVLRNPDAFTWLSRIQEADEYTYAHSLRCSVWAILFGRHIGLDKRELDILAMGVLFKDVGKLKLDRDLLLKTNRTTQEQAQYETFVEKSVEILRRLPGVEPKVVSVVKTHAERVNGSGYPQHLQGDKIPLLGRIAGIVTFYDEVTHPRNALHPVAPSRAVSRLYEVRGSEFQEDLVVEFIRAIGLYPTGTLVELTTGEVAVVIEQNFEKRLKPKVLVILDSLKQELSKYQLLDLAEDDKKKQALIDKGKRLAIEVEKIEIAQDLEPGSFEIDIQAIRDTYIMRAARKSFMGLFSI